MKDDTNMKDVTARIALMHSTFSKSRDKIVHERSTLNQYSVPGSILYRGNNYTTTHKAPLKCTKHPPSTQKTQTYSQPRFLINVWTAHTKTSRHSLKACKREHWKLFPYAPRASDLNDMYLLATKADELLHHACVCQCADITNLVQFIAGNFSQYSAHYLPTPCLG